MAFADDIFRIAQYLTQRVDDIILQIDADLYANIDIVRQGGEVRLKFDGSAYRTELSFHPGDPRNVNTANYLLQILETGASVTLRSYPGFFSQYYMSVEYLPRGEGAPTEFARATHCCELPFFYLFVDEDCCKEMVEKASPTYFMSLAHSLHRNEKVARTMQDIFTTVRILNDVPFYKWGIAARESPFEYAFDERIVTLVIPDVKRRLMQRAFTPPYDDIRPVARTVPIPLGDIYGLSLDEGSFPMTEAELVALLRAEWGITFPAEAQIVPALHIGGGRMARISRAVASQHFPLQIAIFLTVEWIWRLRIFSRGLVDIDPTIKMILQRADELIGWDNSTLVTE